MLALGTGVYLIKFCVTVERRDPGMRLPGKGAPESGSRTAAAPVLGSFLVDDRPVRSPDSCAGVGTRADSVLLRRLRSDSQFPKMNSLFLTIGLPAVKPYWFCRNGALRWAKFEEIRSVHMI